MAEADQIFEEIFISMKDFKSVLDNNETKTQQFLSKLAEEDLSNEIVKMVKNEKKSLEIAHEIMKGFKLNELINCDDEDDELASISERCEKIKISYDHKYIMIAAPGTTDEENKIREAYENFKTICPDFELGAVSEIIKVHTIQGLKNKTEKAFKDHKGKITVIFQGHGGKDGSMKLKNPKLDEEQRMMNYEFADFIEGLKVKNNLASCTLIFAQCYAHVNAPKNKLIDVVYFTSAEDPTTWTRKRGGKWYHVELTEYAERKLEEYNRSMKFNKPSTFQMQEVEKPTDDTDGFY